MRRFVLLLVLVVAMNGYHALRVSAITNRRQVLASAGAVFTVPPACALDAPSTTFGLKAENANVRPFVYYLENANRLAEHLELYAGGVDPQVGVGLEKEITQFATTYAPRPGSLVDAGPTPGLPELKTAYDALAYHLVRYKADTTTPLPDALASTVLRNSKEALKRIRRAQAVRDSAASGAEAS